jgi:hypothetical protein
VPASFLHFAGRLFLARIPLRIALAHHAINTSRGIRRKKKNMKRYISLLAIILVSLVCMADVPANEISREKVLSRGPEWQEKYDGYIPDPERIKALKDLLGESLRIDIYLGLWCADSINNVPPFLKILDATGMPVPVRLFRVERKPVKSIKYFVDKFQVERVPTFIFYRGDTEIGRIVENPKTSLAEDMISILAKH